MTGCDVALARLPQADGLIKLRPVLLLLQLPPFGDWLLCGISSQTQHFVADFNKVIDPTHQDFAPSGLKTSSLVRLGFLATLPESQLAGRLGMISKERHARLLGKLSAHLRPALLPPLAP